MKDKVFQDSKQMLSRQSYILIGIGVLIGIILVSTIKHGEINWTSIGRATGGGAFLFFIYFILFKGKSRMEQKR